MLDWQNLLKPLRSRPSRTRRPRWTNLLLEALEERAVPATVYVNVNGGNDANAGTAAAPFASIQAAVNLAKEYALGEIAPQQNNNTIIVAAGTYFNTSIDSDGTSLGFPAVVGVVDQQVTIQGGYNAAFTAVTGQSVIDGSSAVRGITVAASGSSGAPTTGITLSNFVIQNCLAGPQTSGSTTLTGFGGGMLIDMGGEQTNPTDTLTNVTFNVDKVQGANSGSTSVNSGSAGDAGGGGLAALFANNVTLNNVTFTNNTAQGGNGPVRGGSGLGGALYGGNGAVFNGTNVTFTNNNAIGGTSSGVGIFNGNQFAEGFGGAVALLNQGTAGTFTSVTATGNVAQGGSAGTSTGDFAGDARGGVFYSENANLTLNTSTLTNNTAQGGTAQDGHDATAGGAIYATAFTNGVTITINQDSIINNVANGPTVPGASSQVLGGGLAADNANGDALTMNVTNTLIAGNSVVSPQAATFNSGGGAIWSSGVTINLLQDTIADNTIASTNMTGSAILIYTGTDSLAYDLIANETGTAVASIQGGTVSLTGFCLFANVTTPGLGAQMNLLTAASADFTNSSPQPYSLLSNSPAINAGTGSTT